MTVVWTGFEPFGSHDTNPSWDVARAAAERIDAAASERLAVSYEVAAEWPERARRRFGDDVVCVHVGLAESRASICLETRAQNRVEGRADNTGASLEGRLTTGDETLASPFDLSTWRDALVDPLADAGCPDIRLSDDCGAYVCNALYYRALQTVERAVFVHVPMMEAEAARELGGVLGEVVGARVG